MTAIRSDLEKAVEMFPEIKEFVDYVGDTKGQETLKVENGKLRWSHDRGEGNFYRMEFVLDRNKPNLWVYFREGQLGTAPFQEPAQGEELLRRLPEIFRFLKDTYDRCYVRDTDIFRYATSEETEGVPSLAAKFDLS